MIEPGYIMSERTDYSMKRVPLLGLQYDLSVEALEGDGTRFQFHRIGSWSGSWRSNCLSPWWAGTLGKHRIRRHGTLMTVKVTRWAAGGGPSAWTVGHHQTRPKVMSHVATAVA